MSCLVILPQVDTTALTATVTSQGVALAALLGRMAGVDGVNLSEDQLIAAIRAVNSGQDISIASLLAGNNAEDALIAALQSSFSTLSTTLSGLNTAVGTQGTAITGNTASIATQLTAITALQNLTAGGALVGPFTVQAGGANPLSAYSTTKLKAGTLVMVTDLGGCGGDNLPGPGIAYWTGVEWRRSTRGVQATMDPAATITLDYWMSPTRVKLTGTTVSATRLLVANAKVGHLVSFYKPGLVGGTLAAASINLTGAASATDLTLTGNGLGVYELIASGTLAAVST